MKFNKINTKEELEWKLDNYKGILSEHIIEYLKSLIELDFSVLRDYISNTDRVSLSELDIYKKIAMYNIYNRTIEVINNSDIVVNIENDDYFHKLIINNNTFDRKINIIEYDYSKAFLDDKYADIGYRTDNIGNISLYLLVKNPDMIIYELDRIMKKLEELYDAKNPYANPEGIYEGLSSRWKHIHKEEIDKYEKMFIKLDNYFNSNDNLDNEIELSKYCNDLLLKDFGLTNKDFCDEAKLFKKNNSYLYKKRIKKLPSIEVINNIKYV